MGCLVWTSWESLSAEGVGDDDHDDAAAPGAIVGPGGGGGELCLFIIAGALRVVWLPSILEMRLGSRVVKDDGKQPEDFFRYGTDVIKATKNTRLSPLEFLWLEAMSEL